MPLSLHEARKRGVNGRAPAGGAFARNGQFYKGGQFFEREKDDLNDPTDDDLKRSTAFRGPDEALAVISDLGFSPEELAVASRLASLAHLPPDESLPWAERVGRDLLRSASCYRRISPKQGELLRRILAGFVAGGEPPAPEGAAPSGRCKVVGVVRFVRAYDHAYGSTWKMTIRCDATPESRAPFSVFVAVPRSMLRGRDPEDLVGARVSVVAEWTPKEPGASFAFGKRPVGEILP